MAVERRKAVAHAPPVQASTRAPTHSLARAQAHASAFLATAPPAEPRPRENFELGAARHILRHDLASLPRRAVSHLHASGERTTKSRSFSPSSLLPARPAIVFVVALLSLARPMLTQPGIPGHDLAGAQCVHAARARRAGTRTSCRPRPLAPAALASLAATRTG